MHFSLIEAILSTRFAAKLRSLKRKNTENTLQSCIRKTALDSGKKILDCPSPTRRLDRMGFKQSHPFSFQMKKKKTACLVI